MSNTRYDALRRGVYVLTALACGLGVLWSTHAGWQLGPGLLLALSLPLGVLGDGLRALSLSGEGGNLAAWGLVLALSLLPLLALLPRRRRRDWVDLLPVLAVPVTLGALWCAVNPGRLLAWSVPMERAALSVTLGMLWVCWGVLRLLRAGDGEASGARHTASMLLLDGLGLVFVVSCCGLCPAHWLAARAEFLAGNTGGHGLTELFLALGALVEALPGTAALMVLPTARTLLRLHRAEPFREATVAAAHRLSHRCRLALSAALLTQTGWNLLQLLALPHLRQSDLQLWVPVSGLMFVLLLQLMAQQCTVGQRLQDDHDAII